MDILIKIATILAILAIGWTLAKHGLKGAAHLIGLGAVVLLIAPGAYAAAKAEKELPSRDLSFNYDGDAAEAAKFNIIVQDRLRRTKIAAQRPDIAWTATNIGRRFATA